jgi:transcription-repair coupling factor (superfamily II helicase)
LLEKIFTNSKSIKIGNIVDGSYGYFSDKLSAAQDSDIVIITSDNNRATKIATEIQFFKPNALLFPGWDSTPYDLVSPSKSILENRIHTLSEISESTQNIIVTSVEAIIQKTISKDILDKHTKILSKGDSIDREEFLNFLVSNNYSRASTTNEPGEFSVRGGIVDIFTNGEKHGYRIDFFGDQIEKIKTFDSGTQTSLHETNSITITPSSELILNDEYTSKFKDNLLNIAGPKIQDLNIFENLEQGMKVNAIEQYLPLFYKTSTILDYLNKPILVFDKFTDKDSEHIFKKIDNAYQERKNYSDLPGSILPPEHLWITTDGYKKIISEKNIISLSLSEEPGSLESLPLSTPPNFKILSQKNQGDKIKLFKEYLSSEYKNNKNIILSAFTKGSQARLGKIMKDYDIAHKICENIPEPFKPLLHIIVSPIDEGYLCPEYSFITEKNIFGNAISKLTKKRSNQVKNRAAPASFAMDELVVHNEYGVGRFKGLETIELSYTKHECIKLEYSGEDKLFIPIENINLITKYGSEDSTAQLDSLGTSTWIIKRAKAKEKVKKSAAYLMQIAAQRHQKTADKLEIMPGLYEEFCSTFPYVETEDQDNAINAVKEDLESSKAMDRLVCGDTGFGKTEVAIRAAFIAIKAGKQVALICPTTLLAKQHFKLFKLRLEKFKINVVQLSRLVSAKDTKENIESINEGRADLVIGTHALLNDKIKFKDIGLLIIDEEQHFGVAQKEKLKKFKENIHILTLSATPIPRTLQMSLTGIKDLSVISTPPVNRINTKTVITKFDELIIKEALTKEHQRNGQSFYICPRISDLEDIKRLLSRITPSLKVEIVYGKMPPTAIDKIMGDFCDGKFDILLCTSIIESGIDIPTANTMIVHKSDYFGLSQMYQIKGRIGRSNIESFAYFTFASNKAIKETTLTKLEVLQKNNHLGAGFSIASHDMDLRGYGNMVGEAQSGHIKDIGVELYQNMLTEEINKIKVGDEETKSEPDFTPQINLGTEVFITEDYVTDFDLRLTLYRRIGDLQDEEEIQSFAAEMNDRFGELPVEMENLLNIITIKNLCYRCNISKIDASEKGFAITFIDGGEKQADKILKFILSRPEKINVKPNNRIVVMKSLKDPQERSSYMEKFVKALLSALN